MKKILQSLAVVAICAVGTATAQTFDFNIDFSTTAPNQTITVIPNITISQVGVSTGTFSFVSFGTTFNGTPAMESSAGWTATDPLLAKNFFFDITADAGFTFSLTDVASLVRSTNAGATGAALIVGSSVIDTVSTPNSATPVLSVAGSNLVDFTNLETLRIRIAGYQDGSRTSSGGGVFRIGALEGTLVVIPEPHEYALMFAGLLGLVIVLRRVRSNRAAAVA